MTSSPARVRAKPVQVGGRWACHSTVPSSRAATKRTGSPSSAGYCRPSKKPSTSWGTWSQPGSTTGWSASGSGSAAGGTSASGAVSSITVGVGSGATCPAGSSPEPQAASASGSARAASRVSPRARPDGAGLLTGAPTARVAGRSGGGLAAGPRRAAHWLRPTARRTRSEEHTSELQSRGHLVCRLLLEKKKHEIHKSEHTQNNVISLILCHLLI